MSVIVISTCSASCCVAVFVLNYGIGYISACCKCISKRFACFFICYCVSYIFKSRPPRTGNRHHERHCQAQNIKFFLHVTFSSLKKIKFFSKLHSALWSLKIITLKKIFHHLQNFDIQIKILSC